jgi:hypothetical protein
MCKATFMLRPRREHAAYRTVAAFEDPWAADIGLRGDTWQLPNELAHLDTPTASISATSASSE